MNVKPLFVFFSLFKILTPDPLTFLHNAENEVYTFLSQCLVKCINKFQL